MYGAQTGIAAAVHSALTFIGGWLSPATLFANNEQGAWYDPQDFSQYTNQLGSEVVSNGGFSSATDWTVPVAGASITGGALAFDGATSIGAGIAVTTNTPVSAVVAGRYYRVTYTIIGGTTLPVSMSVGGAFTTAVSAAGTYTEVVFTTTTGAPAILTRTSVGARTGSVDNVSVQELTGLASATLYQDSAGTTPVTAVEQPVGLMLDKRKGPVLGSELVTFASLTGTAEWSYGSNVWTLSGSTTNSQTLSFAGLTSGSWYRMTVTVTAINAGSLSFRHPNSSTVITNSPTISAAGTYTISFVASGTTVFLRNSAVGQTITVSAFSVKELPGNHAYQSTSAARPTLRARYNQLTYSEQFDNAAWTGRTGLLAFGSGSVANTTDTTDPLGGNTADFLAMDGSTGTHTFRQDLGASTVVTSATSSIYLKYKDWQYVALQGPDANYAVVVDLINGTATHTGIYVSAVSITNAGNGWWRLTFNQTQLRYYILLFNNGSTYSNSFTGTSGSGVYIWGADHRASNQIGTGIPSYQRIAAATDYDTVGFPVYIQGNGSSQFMQTASIDFSATDKMTVWAAVRKLSDAAQAAIMELGTDPFSVNGSFGWWAPSGGANYYLRVRGTVVSNAVTLASYAAPISNVLSFTADIAGDSVVMRANGTQAATSVTDLGTGNFGNLALYLFSRNGASIWFGGYFYGAIIRGAASNEAQIQLGERYLQQRSLAY